MDSDWPIRTISGELGPHDTVIGRTSNGGKLAFQISSPRAVPHDYAPRRPREGLAVITGKFLLNRRRHRLSAEALGALEDAVGKVKTVPARQTMVREDSVVTTSTLLVAGFMCRYVDGRNGERQLVAIHVPGDFVDLQSFPLEHLDHAVAALTDATVALFPHETIVSLMARHPQLVRLLWFSTMLDAAISREWIFRLGHLPAIGRVAHLFCELALRLQLVGIGSADTFPLPLIQTDLADACGLTPEHVNRVIRQLRERGVLNFSEGILTILDWEQIKTIAEFDDGYLYIERDPG